MNDQTKPFDDPARESEWLAQERARQAERSRNATREDDARVRQYRLIARALGAAPANPLPADFAASVARRALGQRRSTSGLAADPLASPFERRLLQILVAVFGLAIGIAAALFGGDDAVRAVGRGALHMSAYAKNSWLLALAGCLAFSAIMQFWRPHRH